jgi:hypothetical protein
LAPRCIVTDLDRTLTGPDLVLDEAALDRIRELRARGIVIVVATGRRFDDLLATPLLAAVDAVVAENGAILCIPAEHVLETEHADFAAGARAALAGLAARFSWGRVVGSGPRGLAAPAHEALTRAGIAHVLEFNAEEVMLLPEGVSKAAGVESCARRLGIDASDAWAMGDGENDVSLLRWAGFGLAPANAVEEAKRAADAVVASTYSQAFLDVTAPLVRAPAAARGAPTGP